MNRQKTLELQDGAVLAFDEYGDPTGAPVMFCHGWPSSCTMAQLADEPARGLGVRIISPDRPGISGSTMQRDRKLSDWPGFLQELVNHLEISEFRMLAISGGAPYAYAAAVAMPDRVRAIAIVGGVIPFAELKDLIISIGPTISVVPCASPASSAAFENAAVAAVRRGKPARQCSI